MLLEFENAACPAMAEAVEAIHLDTAIFTTDPTVDELLDQVGWPERSGKLLDPGAGSGAIIIAAMLRLEPDVDDVRKLVDRLEAWEFHPGAAGAARRLFAEALRSRGWGVAAAVEAAERVILVRDFLLSPPTERAYGAIASNPPYMRSAAIPAFYVSQWEGRVPRHARADLLHAFIDRCSAVLADGGCFGLISSDRWLSGLGTAELRRRIGEQLRIVSIRRLDPATAFYRPKRRAKGTPPRIHPVLIALEAVPTGQEISALPFDIDGHKAELEGSVTLGEVLDIRIAPWVGPGGIFLFDRDPPQLAGARFAVAIDTDDISREADELKPPFRKRLLVTDKSEPTPAVLEHLGQALSRMPARGRRNPFWLPPESFGHRLPLACEALLIPRIARRLRTIPMPAGVIPVNHNLYIATGPSSPATISAFLNRPDVQAWAWERAGPLENGFRSFTTGLLRRMPIPDDALPALRGTAVTS